MLWHHCCYLGCQCYRHCRRADTNAVATVGNATATAANAYAGAIANAVATATNATAFRTIASSPLTFSFAAAVNLRFPPSHVSPTPPSHVAPLLPLTRLGSPLTPRVTIHLYFSESFRLKRGGILGFSFVLPFCLFSDFVNDSAGRRYRRRWR